MKKITNAVRVQGRFYAHNLVKKVSGENSKNPGTEFISGTIDVATDEEGLNIVQFHYTYVVPVFTKSNKKNANFAVLNEMIEGRIPSWTKHGKDKAALLRIDSSIDVNDFYTTDNITGEETLVTSMRNEGGFVRVIKAFDEENPDKRNEFRIDMVINNVRRIEANDETETPEHMIVKGATFGFGGGSPTALKPVELVVYKPEAMDYFEGQEISSKNPLFTMVWGPVVNKAIKKKIVETDAFGGEDISYKTRYVKEYMITHASGTPYEWDDEATILATELKTEMSNRELYLADIKRRSDEYKASKKVNIPTAVMADSNDEFDF